MALGPGSAYDLYLRNDPSGTNPEVGLVLDRDEDDKPRVREFRAPSVPPRVQSGSLNWTDKDPLVDYVWSMDDFSDGALRPYYRDGDKRYAQANGVDARGEGVLALGPHISDQLSVALPNVGWESGDNGDWVLTAGSLGGVSEVQDDDANNTPRTGSFCLRLGRSSGGTASTAAFTFPSAMHTALRGRSVTFGVHARRAPNNSGAGNLNVQIADGTGTTTVVLTTIDTYEHESATRTIDGSSSTLVFQLTNASGVAAWNVDDMYFQIGAADTVVGTAEAAGSHYLAFGPIICILDETDEDQPFWRTSTAQTDGAVATSIASFNDSIYVGYGTSQEYIFGTDGSWNNATTDDPDDKAEFWMVRGDELWKNFSSTGVHFVTATSGTVDSTLFNGRPIYNVTDSGSPITGLYMLNHAPIVGTERNVTVFFDDEQRFRTIFAPFQTDPSSENFSKGIAHHDGWLYLTTEKQGLVRFNGFQFEDLSELFMAPRLTDYGGRVIAVASDPYQLWLLVDTPTADATVAKTVRLMSLKQIGGRWKLHDISSPTLGDINALVVAGDYLYGFGRASHEDSAFFMAHYRWALPIKVPFPFADELGGRLLVPTGTIDMPRWHGGQPDAEKALISVDFWVEDTDTNNTIQLGFGVDGAANTTTTFTVVNDTTTSTPAIVNKTTASNLSSGTPSSVAVGRVFDFQFSFVRQATQTDPNLETRSGGAHVSPKLYAFAAHFVLRPTRKKAWEIWFRVGGELLDNGLPNPAGKAATIDNLSTLETQVFPIEMEEDWERDGTADTFAVVIRDLERVIEDISPAKRGRPSMEGEELWRMVLQEV